MTEFLIASLIANYQRYMYNLIVCDNLVVYVGAKRKLRFPDINEYRFAMVFRRLYYDLSCKCNLQGRKKSSF